MSVYSVKGKGWRYDFTQRGQAHRGLVQNQKGSKGGGGKKTAGVEEPAASDGSGDDPNRHGLFHAGK